MKENAKLQTLNFKRQTMRQTAHALRFRSRLVFGVWRLAFGVFPVLADDSATLGYTEPRVAR